jgi:vancomycin aglycone glucosyltransferase
VDDVNHDALFKRVAAVVHHGGAGTTAAAARAGVPQLITPMFSDQFYWSRRVVELGIGTTTSHAGMTDASARSAFRSVLASGVVHTAGAFAKQLRSDGATVAAKRLEADYARPGG